jgi:gliding motility-associated-like protein
MRKAALVVLCSTATLLSFAQFDTRFWMPPIWDTGGGTHNQPSELFITTPSPFPVNVNIQTADGTTFVLDTTVVAGTPLQVPLTPQLGQTDEPNVINMDASLIVTSSQAIQCVHKISGVHNQTLVTLKGRNGRGTDFWAGSQVRNMNANYNPNEYHFISVMAMEDNTSITFETPFDMAATGGGSLPNPLTITLDAEESYLIRSQSPVEHVAGAHVTSDKEIVCISGSTHTRIQGGSAADGGTDQLVPVDLMWKDFVVVKGDNVDPFDYAIIVATEDNTQIFLDGSATPSATIDAGEFWDYTLTGGIGAPHYLRTDKRAYCYHFTGASQDDEVGMSAIPQMDCTGSRYIEFSMFTQNTVNQTMNLIVPPEAEPTLEVNGVPYTSVTGAISNPVPGLAGWVAVALPNAALQPNNIITSDGFFHAGFMTGNGGSTGTYGFLSGFNDAYEFLDPVTLLPTTIYNVDTLCPGESIDHCLLVYSCADDHNIIEFSGNDGNVVITPPTEPFDTCFNYTAPFNYSGLDTVSFTVENRFGFTGSIDLVFVVADPDTPINAGPLQELCATTEGTLSAVDPDPLVPGTWSVISGGSTITDPNNPTTGVTNLALGTNTFLWEQDYGCQVNQALTQINVYDGATPAAQAGPDGFLCSDNNTYVMQANDPGITGIGTWEITQGSATINNINNPTAPITNLGIGENIFEWNIDNGPCPGGATVDEMSIFVYDVNHPDANAGTDQVFCSEVSETTLTGSIPIFPAQGSWTVLQGGGSIAFPGAPVTNVTGLTPGVHIFEWSIDNGPCGVLSDTVTVTIFDGAAEAADAGPDAEYCTPTTMHQLAANDPAGPATGTWTVIEGAATFSDLNDPNAMASNLAVGTNVLRWTIDNGPCAGSGSTDDVIITIFDNTLPPADAGPDQEICESSPAPVQLAAEAADAPATGTWTVISGGASVTDPNDPNSFVNGLSIGENVFEWTVDNGPCGAPTTDTVVITVFSQTIADANAGPDASFCTPTSTYVMQATTPDAPATGTWTLESGTGTIANVNNPTTNISGLGVGANVFRWTIDNGPCTGPPNFDEITIFIYDENQLDANAGVDQEFCQSAVNPAIANLNANGAIFPATGTWSFVQGSGVLSDPNDPNATVTDLAIGENILEWTIDNGPCTPSVTTDQVSIFVYDAAQPAADAGADLDICNDNPSAAFAANAAIAPATGTWTLVSGSGTIADPNDPNSAVTGLGLGVNIFEWTIDNGNCPDAVTSDTMTITVFEGAISPADAGPDQSICSTTAIVNLDGNNPISPASGVWSVVQGSGTFADNTDPNTTVSGLSVGENIFEWTVDNGACSGSTSDQISVFVYDSSQPAANAGTDQELCTPTSTTTLNATAPIFPSTGTWTLVSGSGSFADVNDPNTEVTGLSVGENIFRWTLNNAPCAPATTQDLVSVFVYDLSQTVSAGADQQFCTPVTSTTLNGSAPIAPATGQWTLVSGSGTIVNPANPNSQVTGLGIGENVFEWTISNGPCAGQPLTEAVTITIFDDNQADANAGPDQQLCTPTASTTLAATAANFPATGAWSVVSGSATLVDPSNPNTAVTGLSVGTVVLEWTINNGPCSPATTSDQMVIEIFDNAAEAADAGPDQELCLPIASATMAANAPVAPATGQWTLVSGAGSIVNPTSPTTQINGLAVGVNIFEWSIDNGACGGETTDTVTITVYSNNSPNANAGADQNLCTPDNFTTLNGNSPIFPATGQWTLVSGSGTIVDPSDPNTEVTDLAIGENIFEWTLLNGPCGNASTSNQVSIFVFDGGAPQANAGADQILCTPANSTNMDAIAAVPPGEGSWSLFSGGGSITSVNDPNTAITSLPVGVNTFVWTLDYATCGVQADTVNIIVYDSSLPPANAGADQEFCTPTESTTLNATSVSAPAEGTWTLISGNGEIADANDPNTAVSNLTIGENIFVWTVNNGDCLAEADRTDTVSIFIYDAALPVANAGDDQEICTPDSEVTLEGSLLNGPATGVWTLVSGSGTITDPNNPNTTVTGLPVGEHIFEWTVDNGACPDGITSDQVSIFVFDANQPAANAGPDQELCTPVPSINLAGNAATFPAQGTWTLISGSGTIADANDPNTVVTNLAVGENIFRWRITNGPCGTFTQDFVSIFVFDQFNPAANAGADQELCAPDFATNLQGNDPQFPAGGTWTLFSGSGTIANPNNPNTLITDLAIGENVFVWTVDNGPCADAITSDTVSVFVFDDTAPTADAGADVELCTPNTSVELDGNAPIFPGSGTWTLISGAGTIADAGDPNTTVSDLEVGENIFEWTIYNGPCALSGSSDLVSIFVYDNNQPVADAGPDQELCTPQRSTNLAANDVTFPATGEWTLISGFGDLVDENDPNTLVINLEPGENVFVWTVDNGPCGVATTDTVVISLFEFDAQEALAGPDQELCFPENSTFLAGNALTGAAVGTWTVVQGSGTFADANDPNTEVTDLSIGTNIFAWSIDNGPCGESVDEVAILVFDPDAAVADAGNDQEFCTPISTTTLAGNVPDAPGTGTWTLVSGEGTIDNPNDPNTALSGLTIGENVFQWSIYNGPCAEPTADTVSIFIYDENHPDANAGDDIELCLPVSTASLEATPAIFPAVGTWQLISGSGTISDVNDPNALISGLELGVNTLVWTINNGPCAEAVTNDTLNILVFEEDIVAANAGADQFICSPTTTTVLEADEPAAPNTGQWELISGEAVIQSPFSATTDVSALTVGEHVFAWTIYNGPCEQALSSDTMSVFIYDQNQPAANAGNDIELCLPVDATVLDANAPIFPATGSWTLIEGSAIFADNNDPNTAVSGLGAGVNTFVWSISNGPCDNALTTDTVQVLVFSEDAALADAGDDIQICTPESQVTLQAATPEIPTTGTWTIVEGDGSLSDINDPNAVYSGLTVGEHVLQWTIYNGPCNTNNSVDVVVITVFDAESPVADAGEAIELCSPDEEAQLSAVPPVFPATGTWSILSGSGSISDVNDPNAVITGLDIGVTTLSWNVQNGPCNEESIDTITITVFDPSSPDADAGEDQSFCTPFGGATLEGNAPSPPAQGEWTLISGGATITNPNVPNTTVFDLSSGENVFVWSIYNGPCANSMTTDTVSIFVNDLEVAAADAGPDIELCGLQDEVQMQGSETIGNTATGQWTIIGGAGDFENITNEFSYVQNIPLGVNTYVWTVDNGECGVSSDTVSVILYNPEIPAAFAGESAEICESDFVIFNLQGSEYEAPATGQWTITEGPIEIGSSTDPNATVWDLGSIDSPFGSVTNELIWTIDNGACGTTADTVSYELIDCLTIDIPDAFSPNSDGWNDFFEIPNLDSYPNNTIKIFNRWGALVFEASPYRNDWNGRSQHPATLGEELPVGTYYYILDLGEPGIKPINGYIFLKR